MEGKDLTKGNLFKNMVKFCIPLLITNLLNSMYNLIDGIWVGRLVGDDGVATVTNCWPITLIASSVLSGIAVTASVMVAQKFTSTEKEKIKNIITPMYIVAFLIGLLTSGILIVTLDLWLKLLNTPAEIFIDSKRYLIIYLIGYIFNFLAYTIVESIRATGDSKTPLILLTITNIVNIVLDPIFIKIGLGIVGAAIASALAMIIELIICLIYINKKSELLKFNKQFVKLTKSFLKELFKIACPMIFAELSTILTIMIEVYISNSLGIVGSSSYGIVSKLQTVFYVLGGSVKSLITVVVAQFIGKKAFGEMSTVMKNGLKIISVPTILIAIFLIFFSRWFCTIFTTNEEVIQTAISYLNIIGFAFILIPLCQMLIGFVMGTGNTRYVFVCLFISSISETIVLFAIQNKYNAPFVALGVSILVWYIINIILCAFYYFSNKWKSSIIVELKS